MTDVQRWNADQPPTEADVLQRMRDEGLRPQRWSNGPGDVYAAHTHIYHKVLYVVRGSITFQLPDQGRELTMQPGDRLDLPAHVRHAAIVGPQGVVCLEAQRL